MSSIDERIVQMEFDNSLFDKNVESSIKALEKLNVALKMDGIDENLSNISSNISRMDFSKVEASIGALESRFTSFIGMLKGKLIGDAVEALSSGIKKTALYLPNKIGQAWNQIMSGGMKRATNIDQARFKIEGLGIAWDKVSEDISYGVQDTAYGFDAAASAASQLAASGVQLGDDMKQALRGISGVAAMTSKSYEEIAPIFTKVAGSGRLFATELNSLSARGINAAATIAKYLDKTGKLAGATEEDVHEMTRKGEIDFAIFAAAMDDAFGEHAKEANRTFEGALDNMKAAMSRIGAEIFTPYRAHMRDIFNSIKPIFDAIKSSLAQMGAFKSIGTFFNNVKNLVVGIFGTIKKNAWVFDIFSSGLKRVFDWLSSVVQMVGSWFGIITDPMQAAGNAITNFFDDNFSKVTSFFTGDYKEAADDVETASSKMTASLEEVDALIDRIWNGEFGNGDERFAAIDAMFGVEGAGKAVQNRLNELANVNFRYSDACDLSAITTDRQTESLEKSERTIDSFATTRDKLVETAQSIGDTISSSFTEEDTFSVIGWLTSAISGLRSTFSILGGVVSSVAKGAISGLINIFKIAGSVLGGVTEMIFNGITGLNLWMQEVGAFDFIEGVFKGIFDALSNIFSVIGNLVKLGFKGVGTIFGKIGETISSVVDRVKDFWAQLKESSGFKALETAFDGIKVAFEGIKEKIFGGISGFFEDMAGTEIHLPEIDMEAIVGTVSDALNWISGKVTWLRMQIHDFFKGIKEDETNPFHGIYDFFSNLTFQGILDTVHNKFTKIKDSVSGFLKESGLATKAQNLFNKAVTGVKAAGPKIFNVLLKIATKLAETLGKVKDKVVEFWTAFKETEGYQTLKDGIANAFNGILDFFDRTGTKVLELIESIFGSAEDAADNFELPDFNVVEFANTVSEKIDWLKEKIDNFKNSVKMLFSSGEGEEGGTSVIQSLFNLVTSTDFSSGLEGITDSFGSAKEVILDFIKSIGEALFGANVEAAELEGVDAVGAVTQELPSATGIIDKLTESVDKAKESIHGFFDEFKIAEDEGTVEETTSGFSDFVTFLEGLKETASQIWTEIKPIIEWLMGFAVTKGAIQLMDSLTGMFRSFSSIGYGIRGVLDQVKLSVKKFGKALAREANAKAILYVAAAFGLLAASFVALGQLTPDQFDGAVKGLVAVAGALLVLMIAFRLLFGNSTGFGGRKLTKLEEFQETMAMFGEKMGKALNKFGIAAVLLALAGSVAILVDVIKQLGEMDQGTLIQGGIAVSVLMGVMGGVITMIQRFSTFKTGVGSALAIIALAGAINLLVGAIQTLGEMDIGTLVKGVGAVSVLSVALGYAMKGMQNVKAKPILAFIAVIAAVAIAMWGLSKVKPARLKNVANSLLKVFLSLAAMIAAVGFLAKGMRGQDFSAGKEFLMFTGLFVIIGEIIGGMALLSTQLNTSDMSKFERIADSLSKIFATLGVLFAGLGVLMNFSGESFGEDLKSLGIGVIVTALIDLVGWLSGQYVDTDSGKKFFDDLANGLEAWEEPVRRIGRILGNLIGGFIEGMFGLNQDLGTAIQEFFDNAIKGITEFPSKMSTFSTDLTTALETLKKEAPNWDTSGLTEFNSVMEELAVGVAYLLAVGESITRIQDEDLFGDVINYLPQLAMGVSNFGRTLRMNGFFASGNKEMIASAMSVVSGYADMVSAFAGGLDTEGNWRAGINSSDLENLDNYIGNIQSMAEGLKGYAEAIEGMQAHTGAVQDTAAAVEIIQGIMKTAIEDSGGQLGNEAIWGSGINMLTIAENKDGSFTPLTTLDSYVQNLAPLARGLTDYSVYMEEMAKHTDAINNTKTAVEIIQAIMGTAIADASGIGVLELGYDSFKVTTLTTYIQSLPALADALVDYSEHIAGLKVWDVYRTYIAAQLIENLAALVPRVDYVNDLFGLFTGNKLNDFTTYLGGFGKALADFSFYMQYFKTGAVDGAVDSINSLITMLGSMQSDALNVGLDNGALTGGLSMISQAMTEIDNHFENAAFRGTVESIKTKCNSVGQEFIKAFTDGITNVNVGDSKETKDSFLYMVDSVFGEGGEWAAGIIKGNGTDLAVSFAEGFDEGLKSDDAKIDPMPLIQNMANTIREIGPGQVNHAISGVITAAAFYIASTGGTRIKQGVSTLVSASVSALKTGTSKWKAVGNEWMNGLMQGLNEKLSALKMTVNSISQLSESALKSSSETSSPSKMFARIGGYWMWGLTNGIVDGSTDVYKALTEVSAVGAMKAEDSVDSMAQQAASSIAAAYLYINQVMQDSMNTNPVITPVLDLSMMQNGLYAMNGMMPGSYGYNPLAYSMSAFPGSYSYGYSQQAMSQSNLEAELRGLRSDVKALGEAMSTMGITLDSGVMVGALTPGTDRELGNITKFKERWA